MSPEDLSRFQQKVVEFPDGCHVWIGARIRRGYGHARIDRKPTLAHRAAYEHRHGPIPEGLYVLHDCPDGDDPCCVNPDHLFLGTHADNMADMARKGRGNHEFGERARNAKLSARDVAAIKAMHAAGEGGYGVLARRFGVGRTAIADIVTGRKWAHVEAA